MAAAGGGGAEHGSVHAGCGGAGCGDWEIGGHFGLGRGEEGTGESLLAESVQLVQVFNGGLPVIGPRGIRVKVDRHGRV